MEKTPKPEVFFQSSDRVAGSTSRQTLETAPSPRVLDAEMILREVVMLKPIEFEYPKTGLHHS